MLLDLPSELVVQIVCFLPVESIGRFVCVNKRCKVFGYDDFVWRTKLGEKIYPILYENLHNTLQYSGMDSWREVYMSLYSLQQLYSTNNGIQSSFTVKSSVYGSFTGTHTEFFPLLCSGTSSFLQLQAIPRDINDLNMSQVLNWLQQIHVSRYPEPNGYYYVLKETGSVYYEATMIKPDIEIPSIRTPAMGIGLFLDNNFQVGEGRFPGWYDNSLGYHSDDGKIFFSTCQNIVEEWDIGDIVGCGFNAITKEVFFTKNGRLMDKIEIIDYTNLNAMVAVDSPNWLVINLGQVPFLYSPFNDLEECDLLDSDEITSD